MRSSSMRGAAMAVLVAVLSFAVAGCAIDRIRGDAEQLVAQGDYEHAVQALETGVMQYPGSAQLRGRLLLVRSQALAQLVERARVAQAAGRLDEAETLLRRAVPFDAGGQRAIGLLSDLTIARQQAAALQRADALVAAGHADSALRLVDEALKDNRRHPGLMALQRRLAIDQRQSQVRAVQQGLAETRPITLDFRDANLRAVLDVVSRNSGVNFVLDKDIRDQRVTIYAKAMRFEDALDMLLSTNQLARKVQDARTILIYPNTPEKQREYQEQLVKVFYLANGDAKGAAAFLKSMMKLHEPYVDERGGLLAVHDSLENIQLAERLVALFDNPEPEVLLDAEVLEVSADRLTELGIGLPTQVTLTPLSPGGSSGLTLGGFPLRRGDIGVGLPSVSINAQHTAGDVNTLANPRIRTRSGEKARILIGDKIPIITTTTTPGVAGFVSESVNYQDVGIKLEVEPRVYADDDVSIRLNLEVSSLGAQTKTASGTIAYQISTRNAATLLRLHDGETQLLAGLISSDERSSTAGLPGLSDVPVLGRLFSDQTNSRTKTELVLSITPHIVRGQPHLDAAEAEAWVGTDAYQRLKPAGGRFDMAAADAASPPGGAAAMPPSMRVPVPVPAAVSTPAAAATAPEAVAHALAATGAVPVFWVAPSAVKVGDVFDVLLQMRPGVPSGALALSLRYATDALGLVGFPSSMDEPEATPSGDPQLHDEPPGMQRIDLQRVATPSGEAPLVLARVQFKALKAGSTEIGVKASAPAPSLQPGMPAAWKLDVGP